MTSGIDIGRIFGIKIAVAWSWLIIFLLVAWQLAEFVFPSINPEWSRALNWGMGISASLLLFVSVLAHELGHSLVAQRQGVRVRSITLFLFGGVAGMEREPPTPKAEFLITIIGPIVSFVVGLACIAAAFGTAGGFPGSGQEAAQMLNALGPIGWILYWLGSINIVLALFNLVPGFPLDGGRVLRSVVWKITGDFRKASKWASVSGQLFAGVLIAAGILMVFGVSVPVFGTGVGGIWLVLIGWFLNSAAIQSYQQVKVLQTLEGVPVEELMKTDVPTTSASMSIDELVHDRIMRSDERAFPVIDGDQLQGIVCLDDVRKVPREEWTSTSVREIMTPADRLTTVEAQEDARDAVMRMSSREVNQLPVVDRRGGVRGLLRRGDVMKWISLQSDEHDHDRDRGRQRVR